MSQSLPSVGGCEGSGSPAGALGDAAAFADAMAANVALTLLVGVVHSILLDGLLRKAMVERSFVPVFREVMGTETKLRSASMKR